MKYTTVYLDENKIELFNTCFGKETIKVNGKIVSEKRSISGTEHNFTITENGTEIPCKLTTGMSMNGIIFNLYKNDKPIVEMPKNKSLLYVFVILGVIVGMAVATRFLMNNG